MWIGGHCLVPTAQKLLASLLALLKSPLAHHGLLAAIHMNKQRSTFFSGTGEVEVNGESTAVAVGDAVFIPGNIEHMALNTGTEPLRLLYFFAADSFTDIVYKFPGA